MPNPQITIPVPQGLITDLNKFLSNVQKIQAAAQKQLVQQTRAMPLITRTQHPGSQVLIGMRTIAQRTTKIITHLQGGFDRITYLMGNLGKVFTRGLWGTTELLAATIMTPIGWFTGGFLTGSFIAAGATWLTKFVWNKMVGLGDSMLQDWLISSGVGSTVGGVRAFRATFAGLPQDPALLTNMMQGRFDIASRQLTAIRILGLNKQYQDTVEMAVSATLAASEFMKSQPRGWELAMAERMGLTTIFSQQYLIALQGKSREELVEMAKNFALRRHEFELTDKAVEAWKTFSLQIKALWVKVESIIGEKLADPNSDLVKALTELSKSVNKFLKTILDLVFTEGTVSDVIKLMQKFTLWMKDQENSPDSFIKAAKEGLDELRKAVVVAKNAVLEFGKIFGELPPTRDPNERDKQPGIRPSPNVPGITGPRTRFPITAGPAARSPEKASTSPRAPTTVTPGRTPTREPSRVITPPGAKAPIRTRRPTPQGPAPTTPTTPPQAPDPSRPPLPPVTTTPEPTPLPPPVSPPPIPNVPSAASQPSNRPLAPYTWQRRGEETRIWTRHPSAASSPSDQPLPSLAQRQAGAPEQRPWTRHPGRIDIYDPNQKEALKKAMEQQGEQYWKYGIPLRPEGRAALETGPDPTIPPQYRTQLRGYNFKKYWPEERDPYGRMMGWQRRAQMDKEQQAAMADPSQAAQDLGISSIGGRVPLPPSKPYGIGGDITTGPIVPTAGVAGMRGGPAGSGVRPSVTGPPPFQAAGVRGQQGGPSGATAYGPPRTPQFPAYQDTGRIPKPFISAKPYEPAVIGPTGRIPSGIVMPDPQSYPSVVTGPAGRTPPGVVMPGTQMAPQPPRPPTIITGPRTRMPSGAPVPPSTPANPRGYPWIPDTAERVAVPRGTPLSQAPPIDPGWQVPPPRWGPGNWDNYMAGLAYKETTYNGTTITSGNRGFFQQNGNDVMDAQRRGVANPQHINTGTYQQQLAANKDYIERYSPAAARAIENGNFAEADRLLNGHWTSLPGGAQANQRGRDDTGVTRQEMFEKIRRGEGTRPPGEADVTATTPRAAPTEPSTRAAPSVSSMPGAKMAPNGEPPRAVIIHHTSDRHTPEQTVNIWRNERPGVGSQYIMDRDGVIHDTAKEYNYNGTGHFLPANRQQWTKDAGLHNDNTVGIEVTANNDADVTPKQRENLRKWMNNTYPSTPFFGHSEVSIDRDNEGEFATKAWRQERGINDADKRDLSQYAAHPGAPPTPPISPTPPIPGAAQVTPLPAGTPLSGDPPRDPRWQVPSTRFVEPKTRVADGHGGWSDLPASKHLGASGWHPESVDPRLREILSASKQQFETAHPGYTIVGKSGRRDVGKGAGPHCSKKGAIDMAIVDPQGNEISNEGNDPTGLYHEYARISKGEQVARYPELNDSFAWGGAFGTQKGGGGPPDLMHFDLQGERGHWTQNRMSNMGPWPGLQYGRTPEPPWAAQPKREDPGKLTYDDWVQKYGKATPDDPYNKDILKNMKVDNRSDWDAVMDSKPSYKHESNPAPSSGDDKTAKGSSGGSDKDASPKSDDHDAPTAENHPADLDS